LITVNIIVFIHSIYNIIYFNDETNNERNIVSTDAVPEDVRNYYEDTVDGNQDINKIKKIRESIIKAIISGVVEIVLIYFWIKYYKKYKKAIEDSNVYKKYGKKYKGYIKKSQISAHTELMLTTLTSGKDITVYEYYAIIEFTDDSGEKITFKTPQLNGNPEYLNTKEVSVYTFDGVHYATDFGYIKKPKGDIKDIMYDSTST
jgi:RNase P/RNase MRP subunit p29